MRWVLPGLRGAHVGKGPRGGWAGRGNLCFRSCGPAAAGLCAECHPHTRPVRVQASCEVTGAPSRNARWRPATSQQRSLSARRRAGDSPAQAVSAGSAGRAGGGTGRGGARGRGCAHVVRPVLPPGRVPRTDGRPGTAPGTGTRRGGRGARGSRAPAGREDAADTYLLPRLLSVRGRTGAVERLVHRRLAPAPHVAGRALRRVYIPRPLHVVPPSSLAIGRLGGRCLAPPGGAGPRLPLPRVAGKTRLPRGLGGPRSLSCGAKP